MLISIITATYNSEKFLQSAIDSYNKQDYINKELIVVDGKSNDGTLKIILDNKSIINQQISEKDKGIYDALNKGINLAKGGVIGILHSDDFFADEFTLSQVNNLFENDSSIQAVYGDLQYVDRDYPTQIIRNWISGYYNRDNFKYGWMPPHPTLFIKKSCFVKYGSYDLNYHSAADYDLILRFLFKHQIKTAYLPKVFTIMRVGGLSNHSFQHRLKANKEDRIAMYKNGIKFPLLISILKPLRKLRQYWNKNS
ncbi:glycosyl transferase [Pedobacter psychrophilus]|uniref:Glycosyl transferase n=1 Tax=Pedobacter psychrophilus TaxID=1826909 RepID=A0A179DC52_9SPHI|nr:glycosyltransferase family 2 protein [Pedobacter psychrophilus]OAQ38621.1 glycosyl transferase [Pedobacter psychrophilus]